MNVMQRILATHGQVVNDNNLARDAISRYPGHFKAAKLAEKIEKLFFVQKLLFVGSSQMSRFTFCFFFFEFSFCICIITYCHSNFLEANLICKV